MGALYGFIIMNPFLFLDNPWPLIGSDEDVNETEIMEGEDE